MPTTTSLEPTIEPGVHDILRRHNAEAAFQTACDIARSSFPTMQSFHVELLDDPDEEDKVWVLLRIVLPHAYAWETQHQQELRFHEGMVAQVSLELNPLFGLSIDHLPE
ncbi:MAG TPA: hypothetical protein VMS17_25650 [Gemmataceae bacterium]|nr:hypothetical protein [Gemmataceae bacterium]